MPSKKRSSKTFKRTPSGAQLTRFHGVSELAFPLPERNNGGARKQPYHINPETREEREKRLAARKALTLKAFEIAYENHHRRKAS